MAIEIMIHPDPKRDAKAALLAPTVATWPRYTLKQAVGAFPAGTVLRRAPSSTGNGTRYFVNGSVCTCPDYVHGTAICKHVRAFRLWEASTRPAPVADVEADEALLATLEADHARQRRVLLLTGWTPDELLDNATYAQRAELIARLRSRIAADVR